jgi:hypothetical protein
MYHLVTVGEISRAAIVKIAPQEVEALEVYLAAYEQDPKIVEVAERDGEDRTGFGDSVESLVPHVVAVCQFALHQVALGAAVDVSKEQLRRRSASFLSRFKKALPSMVETAVITRLTPEQLGRVREATCRKSRQMHMADDQASLLADAVVGALVNVAD